MAFNFYEKFQENISEINLKRIDIIKKKINLNSMKNLRDIEDYIYDNFDLKNDSNISIGADIISFQNDMFTISYAPFLKHKIGFSSHHGENLIFEVDNEKGIDTISLTGRLERKDCYYHLVYIGNSNKPTTPVDKVQNDMFKFLIDNITLEKNEIVEIVKLNYDIDLEGNNNFNSMYKTLYLIKDNLINKKNTLNIKPSYQQ